ncbi:MAG: phosphatidylinositol dimannoside acyltransferase [Chloroflexia bacterium]|nr:phosphatidylinositol dimannoside acyltransferase [Chloroflexia bacterium]
MDFVKRALNPIWQGIRYQGYRFFSYLSHRVPLRIGYWIGTLAGDFIYLTWKRHAANAVSNTRRVMGREADWRVVKEKARDSFRNYAKTLVDFLRFPHMSYKEIDRAILGREGLEHLDTARSAGKGVVVVTAHIGNWDIAGALLGHMKLPLHGVADKFEPERMNNLINGVREKHGIHILYLDTGSLRQIFTALKRNEIVLLLFDRPQPEDGVPVEFFGETAFLPPGPAAIAIKTGAALVVGYALRDPGDRTFSGRFEEPIEYKHLLTGDKETDIQRVTQEIVNRFEQVIRQHPDQWYMFREMWPRTARHNAEIKKRRLYGTRSLRRRLAERMPESEGAA